MCLTMMFYVLHNINYNIHNMYICIFILCIIYTGLKILEIGNVIFLFNPRRSVLRLIVIMY